MGFRFRKSVKIAPGVRLNLNRKSASISLGGKGAHYTVSSTGRKTATVGLPGTGISYSVTESTGKSSSRTKSGGTHSSGNGGGKKNKGGCLMILLALMFWPFALSYWIWKTDKFQASKKIRAAIITAFWIVMFCIGTFSGGSQQKAEQPLPTATIAEETPQPTEVDTIDPTIVLYHLRAGFTSNACNFACGETALCGHRPRVACVWRSPPACAAVAPRAKTRSFTSYTYSVGGGF